MRQVSPALLGLVATLLVCCCLASFGSAILIGWNLSAEALVPSEYHIPPIEQPIETIIGSTPAPTRSSTPGPTFTLVNPPVSPAKRTAVPLPASAYVVRVPTPVAPYMTYPIEFTSDLHIDTHPVTGVTLKELSHSLDVNALSDPHEPGSHFYARTDWSLTGNWSWSQSLTGCRIAKGDVSIIMTITLPVELSTGVPADVATRWNKFVENTITHETGHVQLDLQGAREYQRQLGNLPPAANCDSLKVGLDRLFQQQYNSIDRANVDYDASTQHGATQGAVFP